MKMSQAGEILPTYPAAAAAAEKRARARSGDSEDVRVVHGWMWGEGGHERAGQQSRQAGRTRDQHRQQ